MAHRDMYSGWPHDTGNDGTHLFQHFASSLAAGIHSRMHSTSDKNLHKARTLQRHYDILLRSSLTGIG